MPRSWVLLLLPLCLGGCGLPPIVTASVYVIDGFLLLGTGKSSADHGLSLVSGQDCAAWRLVEGDAICEDPVLLAQAENAAAVPDLAELGGIETVLAAAKAKPELPVPAQPVLAVSAKPALRQPHPARLPGLDGIEQKPIPAAGRPLRAAQAACMTPASCALGLP